MPLSGGAFSPVAAVGGFPQRLLARNGLLYLLDTEDGERFGIWALDVARRRSAPLVRDLPLVGIDLDVSARWLYVWVARCPDRACGVLDRRRIEAWDRVGPPESVDPRQGVENTIFPFRTDGTHLYYWLPDEGLKRLAE
jgi:hypothetical protein